MTGFVWRTRSMEERTLLNPAFCGELLHLAAVEYGGAGLPFPLSFLVLPLVLHKKSREALPSIIRTSIPTWLQRHPEVKIGFDERVTQTAPITREAVAFLLAHQKLRIAAGGTLLPDGTVKHDHDPGSDEVKACIAKARFLGRWLQRSGTPATIFALFGIRP
jgi:hypothetical protein